MRTLCFYHKVDLDGICSAGIVKMKYPDAILYPINYGDPFPWNDIRKDDVVFMVDFGLQPFSDMVKLNNLCKLHWIDHHKTAMDDARKVGFQASGGQLIKDGIAGCELSWKYLFPKVSMPRIVYLLGRYDVWDHKNAPDAKPFQFGAQTYDLKPEDIKEFLNEDVNNIIFIGKKILKYIKIRSKQETAKCAFDLTFEGINFAATNSPLNSSMSIEGYYDESKHDAMLVYCINSNGNYMISVYSDKDHIDVSVIAKKYGGGGHRGAAGFELEELPFKIQE